MGVATTNHVFLPINIQVNQDRPGEISRLFTAALVDRQFCETLLKKPDLALAGGYNGETFLLNSKDRNFILTAKPASLSDLAEKWIQSNNYSNIYQ